MSAARMQDCTRCRGMLVSMDIFVGARWTRITTRDYGEVWRIVRAEDETLYQHPE
jgi:hypothetical protein